MIDTLPADGYYFLSASDAGMTNRLSEDVRDLFDDDTRDICFGRSIIHSIKDVKEVIDKLVSEFNSNGLIYNLVVEAHGGADENGEFYITIEDVLDETQQAVISSRELLEQLGRLNFVYHNRLCVFLSSCQGAKILSADKYFTSKEGFYWRRLIAPMPKVNTGDMYTNFMVYFTRVREAQTDCIVSQIGRDFIEECQLVLEDNLGTLFRRTEEFVLEIDDPSLIAEQIKTITATGNMSYVQVTPVNKGKLRELLYKLMLQTFYYRNYLSQLGGDEYLMIIGSSQFIDLLHKLELQTRKNYAKPNIVAVDVRDLAKNITS